MAIVNKQYSYGIELLAIKFSFRVELPMDFLMEQGLSAVKFRDVALLLAFRALQVLSRVYVVLMGNSGAVFGWFIALNFKIKDRHLIVAKN